jgi:hypothetical protein
MPNPAKRKGDHAELEAARLLADLTGWPVRRKLGAGRSDDTGDLDGVPDTCVSVKNRATWDRVPSWLRQLEQQQTNAGTTFGTLLLRCRGGLWIAVHTLEQEATLLREATPELLRPAAYAPIPITHVGNQQ